MDLLVRCTGKGGDSGLSHEYRSDPQCRSPARSIYAGSTQYLSAEHRCTRGWWLICLLSCPTGCLSPHRLPDTVSELQPAFPTLLPVGPLCSLRGWREEAGSFSSTPVLCQAYLYRGVNQAYSEGSAPGRTLRGLAWSPSGSMGVIHTKNSDGPLRSEDRWGEPHLMVTVAKRPSLVGL